MPRLAKVAYALAIVSGEMLGRSRARSTGASGSFVPSARIDAELLRHLRHRAEADLADHLHEVGVDRLRHRRPSARTGRSRTRSRSRSRLASPAVDPRPAVAASGSGSGSPSCTAPEYILRRRHALLQGGRRDERLEGRTDLEAEVRAAHPLVDGVVDLRSRSSRSRTASTGPSPGSCRCPAGPWSRPSATVSVLVDVVLDRLVGRRPAPAGRASSGSSGRPGSRPSARSSRGLAEDRVGQEGLAHVVAEEAGALDRGDAAVLRLADLQLDRLRLRLVRLRLRDVARRRPSAGARCCGA